MEQLFSLEKAVEILERTPEVLEALLGDLSPDWTEATETSESWSPRQVLGHLIHGENTDWIPRVRIILNEEDGVFEPFDRHAQQGRDPDEGIERMLGEFKSLRVRNLSILASFEITPLQLTKTGMHPDPELGKVTLEQLLATWAVHDLAHLSQITRAMQTHWREAIGPWRRYFSLFS